MLQSKLNYTLSWLHIFTPHLAINVIFCQIKKNILFTKIPLLAQSQKCDLQLRNSGTIFVAPWQVIVDVFTVNGVVLIVQPLI